MRIAPSTIALTLLFTVAGAAVAQPPAAGDAIVLDNAAIAAALAAYRPGGRTAHAIAPAGAFRYWAVVRTRPGSVEIHRDWVDVTIVRSGSGLLRTGVRTTGTTETAPGEWRGGRILDPHQRPIAAGDILVVPAGIAHQFVPTGKAPLEYVTVKVAAPPRAEARKQ